MTGTWAATGLLACALLIDVLVGTLRTGLVTVPVATLCAVSALGATTRYRAAAAGFWAGAVLDLLAGPATPGGLHALIGVTLGAASGRAHQVGRRPSTPTAAVHGLLVAAGASATLGLQQLRWPWQVAPRATVLAAAVVAVVISPRFVTLLVRALPPRSDDDVGFR